MLLSQGHGSSETPYSDWQLLSHLWTYNWNTLQQKLGITIKINEDCLSPFPEQRPPTRIYQPSRSGPVSPGAPGPSHPPSVSHYVPVPSVPRLAFLLLLRVPSEGLPCTGYMFPESMSNLFPATFQISSFTGFWLICCPRSSLIKNHSKQAMIYDLISQDTEQAQPLTTFIQFTTFWKLIIILWEMLYSSFLYWTHKTKICTIHECMCSTKTYPEKF